MAIQDEILQTILRQLPQPSFNPKAGIGEAEVQFNTRMDQALTNVHGQGRTERLQSQFPIKAYRMLKQPYREDYNSRWGEEFQPQFFTDDPAVLDTYNPIGDQPGQYGVQQQLEYLDEGGTSPTALPANLDLGKVLVVDAPGQHWNRIQYEGIPDENVIQILARDGWDVPDPSKPPPGNGIVYGTSTDAIVQAAAELGYDSVQFKDLVDLGGYKSYTGPKEGQSNIYAIINPSLIRASTALADPKKKSQNHILAELGLATGAGGAASALAGNEDIRDTIG